MLVNSHFYGYFFIDITSKNCYDFTEWLTIRKGGERMRDKLVAYRGKRSQKAMAKKYGVSQQAWSFWESGKTTPRPEKMKRIARDIKLPIEAIFF